MRIIQTFQIASSDEIDHELFLIDGFWLDNGHFCSKEKLQPGNVVFDNEKWYQVRSALQTEEDYYDHAVDRIR